MLSQIAGWSVVADRPDRGRAAHAAMLEAGTPSTAACDAGRSWTRVGESSALGQRGAPLSAHPGSEGAPWCAIDGHPTWNEPRMSELAREESDRAALADGFARHGFDVVRFLSGRFRLAVVQGERVLLAVDRVGTLPLYFARPAPHGVVFASSVDALRAHGAVGQQLSAQAMAEYFHFQVTYGARTVFRGVEKLQPGHRLVLDGAACAVDAYWHPRYAPPRRCSPSEEHALRDELRDRLRGSVHREIDGVPGGEIGAFLSGGLDSSAVLGLATEQLGTTVPTFTVRFDVPGYDESEYAALAAQRFGARAHVCTLSARDMACDLDRIARVFDEPFGNSSAAGAHHCAALAREAGVRTMLSGDGGDELFAGGSDYVLMQRFELFGRLPATLQAGLASTLEHLPGIDRVPVLARARKYVRRARIPMPARIRSYDYLTTSTYPNVFTPEFLGAIDPHGAFESMERTYSLAGSADELQRHLHLAMCTLVADNDVPKVRRTCELEGIEARFPLLDDTLHEFVATVPSNVLIKHLHERAFYREALRGFLPEEIIHKSKHCFAHPLQAWLSAPSPLRDAVVESLQAFARRGIVRADLVERLVCQPALAAQPDMTRLMWYMAVLERWLQIRGLDLWS
jgi:asparagine synthase (glutamine-hydrolysing)